MSKVTGNIREALERLLYLLKGMGVKKLIRIFIPYVIAAYIGNKVSLLWRNTGGTGIAKVLAVIRTFSEAFKNPFPSIVPKDILAGVVAGILLRLAVYYRSMTAKKFRHGMEYGSARWGTQKDIMPYMDPVFKNNIILTQTERLTMESRPKNPKLARNKNVIVVGGSGSGKTRFYVKPQLMQMHSSYVVTDPKGYLCVGQ